MKQLAGHQGAVYCVRFSDDGAQLLSAGIDGTARLWDTTTLREVRRILQAVRSPTDFPSFSGDGSTLAVSSERHIRIWDLVDSTGFALPLQPEPIYLLSVAGNGKSLAVISGAGKLKLVRRAMP